MSKIVKVMELLRVEDSDFVIDNWPEGANVALYMSSDATIIIPVGLSKDEEMWPVHHNEEYVGWHMWEHADEHYEHLKYKQLQANGSPWIFYAYIDHIKSYPRAYKIAKEVVFRAEVWTGHAE